MSHSVLINGFLRSALAGTGFCIHPRRVFTVIARGSWCSEMPGACAGRGTWSRDAGTGSTALADVAVAPRVLGSRLACGGARQGSEAFSSPAPAGPAGAQDVGSPRAGARSVWSPLLSGHPGQGTPDVCRALSDRSWNHEARLTPSGRAERPGRTDLGEETFVHGA